MNLVSFYEISHGHSSDNDVRVGTGTVEEVRRMGRPSCYLCLHGSVDPDQGTAPAKLGFATLAEASEVFKTLDRDGLERNGAPISLAAHGASLINRALPVVRAFAEEAIPTQSAQWFAIDAAQDHVVPVTEQDAWDGLASAGSTQWWERMSYVSVSGPRDDLVLVFNLIVRSYQDGQERSRMDTEMP
jgi:hypothetical protein